MSGSGLSRTRLERVHQVLDAHVRQGEVPGLVALVSRRGVTHMDILGHHAPGGTRTPGNREMRRTTIFRIASMTKPVLAAATMMLVESCRLRLDDPVDEFLPELANRRVLARLDGPLSDTVPAGRPITTRDLLTFGAGFGLVLAPPTVPLRRAMQAAGLEPGPVPAQFDADEFMRRLGELPLAHAPGEGWMYHTASDVLGVLLARASGKSLETLLRQLLFDPLGMKDTGFHVPAEKRDRLPPTWRHDAASDALVLHDAPDGAFASPPVFASGGGGLVSTADDYLAFARLLLGGGRVGSERLLSSGAVALMTGDRLGAGQRPAAAGFLGEHYGWGFGVSVCTARYQLWDNPGRFGWDGGMGTSAYMDPAEDLVGILLTQRLMDSPAPPKVFQDFWTSVYQSIDE
jgi:CubicO group peptidase (beta-lactamase class C family)